MMNISHIPTLVNSNYGLFHRRVGARFSLSVTVDAFVRQSSYTDYFYRRWVK